MSHSLSPWMTWPTRSPGTQLLEQISGVNHHFELLKAEAVLQLDEALERYNANLPRLKEFILPAGNRGAALAHVCRTVARRAERAVVALGNEEALKDAPRQYLNRLSDLMFVLARVLNRKDGGDDVYWKSERVKTA